MCVEIPSLLGKEKIVIEKLDEVLPSSYCDEKDRMDVKTAIAEACLNAMEHGNGLNPDLPVTVFIQFLNHTVTVEVYDRGIGAELQALPGSSGEKGESCRGWGLYMIDKLVDAWEYYYNPVDQLFCVKMIKTIGKGR